MISPVHALAYQDALADLPEDLAALLSFAANLSLRPEQRMPKGDWRSVGYLTGRGWGKSHAVAVEINRRVAAGDCQRPLLIAPTLDRVRDVQTIALVETSPAHCRCAEYQGGVRWENGVVARAATAEINRPASGRNVDLAWLTEIVHWSEHTRRSAFNDVTTACRRGPRPQYLWDTTSSGKNDVIQFLIEQHENDPAQHHLIRGTMFDNPLLPKQYVIDEARKYVKGTRGYEEEILGLVFAGVAGALWDQEWIDQHRVSARPLDPHVILLGLDPALSGSVYSDEVGIAKAYCTADGHIYLEDLSDRMAPEDYATIVVHECRRDASGVIVERNHVGQHARDLIRIHARLAGMSIELLPDPSRPFPSRRPGVIFIREIVSDQKKETRAAPAAALAKAGRVHHIGDLARLEHEQTTWVPAQSRSPNRLDAAVFAINELGGALANAVRSTTRQDVATALRAARHMRDRLGPRRIG